ncbi:T9SS type A sorting domain-containing protein [Hymenobacter sp. GOD-10R]|uniref:T9SS type A sorting domain-containing protein n=1 Tax=Hymenobacter sp. GOD-10R TaxID=3093922 RepID=UPI002D786B9C|nr:T9SS type A sorting domain-containing protein [Hymenobacter sp. GOD-10R]WRQ27605.1 T9SS type A sorting domain-containing protein [Hymenobacter sp. GOD-10R]
MRKALLFANLLLSFGAFSQSAPTPAPKAPQDANGFPSGNVATHSQTTSPSASTTATTYSYTGVRALTEINDANDADAYPWLSPSGLRLYYITGTDSKLMFTQRTSITGSFCAPITVPLALPYAPSSCWLSANELDIYFTANNCLYFAQRPSLTASFGAPAMVSLTGLLTSFIAAPSLTTTKDRLFLFAAAIGIVEFARTSATSFNYVRTLPVPAGYQPFPGQLSKDDLTYFLGASHGTAQRSLYQITRPTTTDAFNASSFQQVQGLSDVTLYNGQPSMSANMECMAFTGTSFNSWSSNELYLATRSTATILSAAKGAQLNVAIYPNPAADYIKLKYAYSAAHPGTLAIMATTGATVLTQPLNDASGQLTLNTQGLRNGVYLYRISQLDNDKLAVSTGKFVVAH